MQVNKDMSVSCISLLEVNQRRSQALDTFPNLRCGSQCTTY